MPTTSPSLNVSGELEVSVQGQAFTVRGDGERLVVNFPTWRAARRAVRTLKPWIRRLVERQAGLGKRPDVEVHIGERRALRLPRGVPGKTRGRGFLPAGLTVHSLGGAGLLLAS